MHSATVQKCQGLCYLAAKPVIIPHYEIIINHHHFIQELLTPTPTQALQVLTKLSWSVSGQDRLAMDAKFRYELSQSSGLCLAARLTQPGGGTTLPNLQRRIKAADPPSPTIPVILTSPEREIETFKG